jgi:hypothetical protein
MWFCISSHLGCYTENAVMDLDTDIDRLDYSHTAKTSDELEASKKSAIFFKL